MGLEYLVNRHNLVVFGECCINILLYNPGLHIRIIKQAYVHFNDVDIGQGLGKYAGKHVCDAGLARSNNRKRIKPTKPHQCRRHRMDVDIDSDSFADDAPRVSFVLWRNESSQKRPFNGHSDVYYCVPHHDLMVHGLVFFVFQHGRASLWGI